MCRYLYYLSEIPPDLWLDELCSKKNLSVYDYLFIYLRFLH